MLFLVSRSPPECAEKPPPSVETRDAAGTGLVPHGCANAPRKGGRQPRRRRTV